MDFFLLSKADPGPVHQARARRLRNVSGGFFVVNFESVTRRYFNNSQHAMFTMLLFSVLILKSKQDPKNSTASGLLLPLLKFLDPPLPIV